MIGHIEVADSSGLSSRYYSRPHKHYDCELLCVSSGAVKVSLPQRPYVLHEGDVMAICPGVVHTISKVESKSDFISVIADIDKASAAKELFEAFETMLSYANEKHSERLVIRSFREPELLKMFKDCLREGSSDEWGSYVSLEATFAKLVVQIIRMWRRTGLFDSVSRVLDEKLTLEKVSDYIDKHFDEPLRVETLAKMCDMSYSHFARCFKASNGVSCKEYIERIRVERAKSLLMTTDYDISFISQELGFSDCSHLIRIFKKQCGITPKKYRESVKDI